LKNNPAKFHPDQTSNNGAFGFFEEVAPTRRTRKNEMAIISSCAIAVTANDMIFENLYFTR